MTQKCTMDVFFIILVAVFVVSDSGQLQSENQKLDANIKKLLFQVDYMSRTLKEVYTDLSQVKKTLIEKTQQEVLDRKSTEIILEQFFRTSCTDLAAHGPPLVCGIPESKPRSLNGVFTILLPQATPVQVRCESNVEGIWTVILSRLDGSERFDRTYEEYANGFGNPDKEFYIGNEVLHKLTTAQPHMLRVEMEDFPGQSAVVHYDEFRISDEHSRYNLTVSGFDKSCKKAGDGFSIHNGMTFSALDKADESGSNCAKEMGGGGGWWYSKCYHVLGTGRHRRTQGNNYGGISWWPWHNVKHSLKTFKMMIRPIHQNNKNKPTCKE